MYNRLQYSSKGREYYRNWTWKHFSNSIELRGLSFSRYRDLRPLCFSSQLETMREPHSAPTASHPRIREKWCRKRKTRNFVLEISLHGPQRTCTVTGQNAIQNAKSPHARFTCHGHRWYNTDNQPVRVYNHSISPEKEKRGFWVLEKTKVTAEQDAEGAKRYAKNCPP